MVKTRKNRTHRVRKSFRHSKKHGAGYSVGPAYVSAGNLVNIRYPGPNDCAGVPERFGLTTVIPKGLPGLSGGKRRRRRGGATLPHVARVDLNDAMASPINGAITPPPASVYPSPPLASGGVGAPGVPPHMPQQNGGRYESTFQVLNPSNGVGLASYATIGSIPCERGTTDSLNPNPNGIQTMTTLPQKMSGGGSLVPAPVTVGAVDSMRYYAPNAGYTNSPIVLPPGGASPGFMAQIGYPAGQFNRACLTTGGGLPVAMDAGSVHKLTLQEIGNRSDFDGTKGGLPVKFGGKRNRRKTSKKSRKMRKSKKYSRKHK